MGIRVYRPAVPEGFEWVLPFDQEAFEGVNRLVGSPMAAQWQPTRVQMLAADESGKPRRPADMPWLGEDALVFRDRAYQIVAEILSDAGEFLPLDLVDGTDRLWLFNACSVVDALDEESSELVRFPSSGRIMKIQKHVFHADRIAGQIAFRIPQVRTLFLTDPAVSAIQDAALTGTRFELLWEEPDTDPV